MKIGIIGCGNISTAYLRLASIFNNLQVVACADIDESAANAQAEAFSIRALSVEALLADSDIQLIVNLTIPAAHAKISRSILESGKHVYSEKPYVLSLEEGVELRTLAESKGLRIGSAPDTFLGGAHQKARDIIDAGLIGDVVGGSCHFMNHGMEDWHPNPDFFYQAGGGPMLDMGAYYIGNLVQLIGPVRRLMAMSSTPFQSRVIGSEQRRGEQLAVNTPTSINSLLEFHNGAQFTVSMSWDVWQHEHNRIELYGTEATLHVPDPNFFGGTLRICKGEEDELIEANHPFSVLNEEEEDGNLLANYRGVGLSDMVAAIAENRPHRCNDTFALHVIDVMTSAMHSGVAGQAVDILSSCERPEAMNAAAAARLLA